MELVILLLAAVGMSHILVDGSIFTWLRQGLKNRGWNTIIDDFSNPVEEEKKGYGFSRWLYEGMTCYQCSGLWAGIVASIIYAISFIDGMTWFKYLLYPFAASYLSMLGAVILIYLNTWSDNGTGGNKTGTTER